MVQKVRDFFSFCILGMLPVDQSFFSDGEMTMQVLFEFESGECYEITVAGWSTQEGDYALSITCGSRSEPIEVECGSNVLGSTDVFLGVQPFLFCSKETKRVGASTSSHRS